LHALTADRRQILPEERCL